MQRVDRSAIDEKRWNQCVADSGTDLPYGFCWYLDALSNQWDGLILGDYEVVFPLVWERKWGMKRVYQPYYCQQLGFLGKRLPSSAELDWVFGELRKFWFVDLHLNYLNQIEGEHLLPRENLVLPLSFSYEQLFEGFSRDLRKCIRAASRNGLTISSPEQPKVFIDYYLSFLDRGKFNVKPRHEKIVMDLVYAAHKQQVSQFRLVHHPDLGVIFCQFMINYNRRLLNLMAEGIPEARSLRANHFVLNSLIREYAGTPYILDFEGSSIPAISDFFRRFNPQRQPYLRFHRSIIPFLG